MLGILFSGPLALVSVNAVHAQPEWQDAKVFATHYHPIQVLPYFGGMLLIAAGVVLIASVHTLAHRTEKVRTAAALVFTGAFAALIFLNYAVQTTFLPAVVNPYQEEHASIIAMLSMSNPTSLAWSIEMWGWALFGVATWLVAPVFRGGRTQRVTARLFVANGVVSLVSAIATAAQPGWCVTSFGLAAFVLWNVLLLIMAAYAWLAFREIGTRSAMAS
jgi:hypothetical protein